MVKLRSFDRKDPADIMHDIDTARGIIHAIADSSPCHVAFAIGGVIVHCLARSSSEYEASTLREALCVV